MNGGRQIRMTPSTASTKEVKGAKGIKEVKEEKVKPGSATIVANGDIWLKIAGRGETAKERTRERAREEAKRRAKEETKAKAKAKGKVMEIMDRAKEGKEIITEAKVRANPAHNATHVVDGDTWARMECAPGTGGIGRNSEEGKEASGR